MIAATDQSYVQLFAEEMGVSEARAAEIVEINAIPQDELDKYMARRTSKGIEVCTADLLRFAKRLKARPKAAATANPPPTGSPSKSYQSRPIKRGRRTAADIAALKSALYDIIEANRPMSVRQIFYQATTLGLIPKTESAYKNTIVRLLTQMRRDGDLPYSWIADSTRWMRKPTTYSGLAECLENMHDYYRRDLWGSQNDYVEIWLEKDALAGVIYPATAKWQVPLMVTRGYPSLSFLASAAAEIAEKGKPVVLYYFGDRDPSGLDIPRATEERLREMAPEADITFLHMAVTEEQIEEMDLPTRPTKTTDSRSKNFRGESVELDAIPPDVLRRLVLDCIEQHIDRGQLEQCRRIEGVERDVLESMAMEYGEDAA